MKQTRIVKRVYGGILSRFAVIGEMFTRDKVEGDNKWRVTLFDLDPIDNLVVQKALRLATESCDDPVSDY